MVSLVWMRRDLRLDDHAALATALAGADPVQPVFVFDTAILERFTNPDDRRLSFIAEALCQIHRTLEKRGGQLLVLHGDARVILPKLAAAVQAQLLVCAEDIEPDARARDQSVKQALGVGTRFVSVLDHLLRPPSHMVKDDKTPYKVFTPYYKRWRASLGPEDLAEYAVKDAKRYADTAMLRPLAEHAGLRVITPDDGPEALLAAVGYRYQKDPLWSVTGVRARLDAFLAHAADYPTARDVLALDGTSRLSPYLRFGLISIRETVRAAIEQGQAEKWISELGWREFYAGILYHFPEVVTQEFTPVYRGTIPWVTDGELVQAFKEGRTGYPLIDAGVRELLATGTMHNRARMIVASFVTKDLLIDWRVGEEFFAQHLMDYELASNNGGWQWAASTGTDASPYFRIFNPVTQGQKFDPKGEYVRRHVPELRAMPDKYIHAPWQSGERPKQYPRPIVDHAEARERAIAVFKAAGKPLP